MAVPARISLVTIGVSDLARSVAFYEALGWVRSPSSVDGVVTFFPTPDTCLSLFPLEELARDVGLDPAPPPLFRGITFAINLEQEADVDRALADALAAGGTLVRAARRADWGGWTGYFADPDGVLWEVAHNPAFRFDERGHLLVGE